MEIKIEKSENPPIICGECNKQTRYYVESISLEIYGAGFRALIPNHLFNGHVCLDCLTEKLLLLKNEKIHFE